MRINSRSGAAAVAFAVMAGIGLTGAPAQAKVPAVVSGTAEIALAPSLLTEMSKNGIQFTPLEPAYWGVGELTREPLVFPVNKRATRGALPLEGSLAVAASVARLDLVDPRLEFAAGATTGQITLVTAYVPADGPADLADGTRIALFKVTSLTSTSKKGRVKQAGKVWTRTDTQRITGQVSFGDDATLLASVNSYIGAGLFAPGLEFGALDARILTKVTCSTRAACR